MSWSSCRPPAAVEARKPLLPFVCAGAGRGSRTPKTRRSADFESLSRETTHSFSDLESLVWQRVKQIDLLARTIRLEPGTTKNRDGREVTMTRRVHELLKLCAFGKTGDSFVFTRSNGKPVRDFRGSWAKACEQAGVPGLLFHDLRRTAARNLRKAGVAEGVIMKIGGWRTRSVFERYAIVSQADIAEALGRLELREGHSLGHSEKKEEQPTSDSPN
jgi:Cu/Ag efflux protein CusF